MWAGAGVYAGASARECAYTWACMTCLSVLRFIGLLAGGHLLCRLLSVALWFVVVLLACRVAPVVVGLLVGGLVWIW